MAAVMLGAGAVHAQSVTVGSPDGCTAGSLWGAGWLVEGPATVPAERAATRDTDAGATVAGAGEAGCDSAEALAIVARLQASLAAPVAPVPEPPSYAMMLLGFVAIAFALRRRRPPGDD